MCFTVTKTISRISSSKSNKKKRIHKVSVGFMILTVLWKLIDELSCLIYWLKNTKKMRTVISINCCCSTEASCLLIPKFLSAFEEPAAAGKSEFKPFVFYGSNYFEKRGYWIKKKLFCKHAFHAKKFQRKFLSECCLRKKNFFSK